MTDPGYPPPSPWVQRWAGLITPAGQVLDVAAGRGRHSFALAGRGHRVTAVDRDASRLREVPDAGQLEIVEADLEAGPWPFPDRTFDGVIVVNYLHRPLFADLIAAVGPLGVLIYETFMVGQERFGRPTNPAFLLRDGELLDVVRPALRVIAYEALLLTEPRTALVQRIVAQR